MIRHGFSLRRQPEMVTKTTAMVRSEEKRQQRDGGFLDIGATLAVAAADFRSHRRRPVVWLLVLLALGVMLAPAYYHAHLHEVRSGHWPIAGLFWPRFRLAEYGGHLVFLLALACLLLGFDARERDTNASMAEALDCRPCRTWRFCLVGFWRSLAQLGYLARC